MRGDKLLMLNNSIDYVINHWSLLMTLTLEHITITATAILLAITFAVPLGILLTRCKKIDGTIMGIVGVLQTIPSMAMLALMIPFLGIGFKPAVLALFLYALLPIVRNTYTGIKGVTPELVEAARGMGMNPMQILLKIQVPIALPIIVAGIRTATVICVGTATIAALIGFGGLGSLIYRGLQQLTTEYIVVGAFFSALLAIFMDLLLGAVEWLLTPKGMRNRARV